MDEYDRGYSDGVAAGHERCARLIEEYATTYFEKWASISGENRAKAGAWDFKVFAHDLRSQVSAGDKP